MTSNTDRFALPWRVHPDLAHIVVSATGTPVCACDTIDEVQGWLPDNNDNALKIVAAANAGVEQNIDMLQAAVIMWANRDLPGRQQQAAWLKLYEELGEILRDTRSRDEWADVFIMLLDLAAMNGITDLATVILDKLAINARRKWTLAPSGVFTHERNDND